MLLNWRKAHLFLCDIGSAMAKKKASKPVSDKVIHPNHYNAGGIEVWDALEAWGLDKRAYLWNAVKYIARCQFKGTEIEDIRKAANYIQKELVRLGDVQTISDKKRGKRDSKAA